MGTNVLHKSASESRVVRNPVAHPSHGQDTVNSKRGFSLVELIFVMILVGIMASIAAPLFSPGRWRADNAVQEVVLGLNAAQRLAVLKQHDIHVTFMVDERRVRLHEDSNNDGDIDTGENWRIIDLPETIAFSIGSAPRLREGNPPISFDTGNGDPVLTFHRNGSASKSGVVYLRPVQGDMAASPEAVRALTVERATGEVACHSYRTGAWEFSC